jgi:hypothetical protein
MLEVLRRGRARFGVRMTVIPVNVFHRPRRRRQVARVPSRGASVSVHGWAKARCRHPHQQTGRERPRETGPGTPMRSGGGVAHARSAVPGQNRGRQKPPPVSAADSAADSAANGDLHQYGQGLTSAFATSGRSQRRGAKGLSRSTSRGKRPPGSLRVSLPPQHGRMVLCSGQGETRIRAPKSSVIPSSFREAPDGSRCKDRHPPQLGEPTLPSRVQCGRTEGCED